MQAVQLGAALGHVKGQVVKSDTALFPKSSEYAQHMHSSDMVLWTYDTSSWEVDTGGLPQVGSDPGLM